MGMTVWMHVLNGRDIEGNKSDCSWMNRLAKDLDRWCERDGVAALSSFFDYTELVANMLGPGEEEEPSEDPATEASYGVDDMKWFDAESGLRTLEKLAELVNSGERCPGLPAERSGDLLDEIQDCIRQLKPAAEKRQKFHLAVIM